MACDAKNCKEFIMNNKSKFGITENNLKTECLDICTQNVRCIAARKIKECIPLPSISSFMNSCTGLVDTASGIDTKFASLRVTYAKEELVDCNTNRPGVHVVIKGQVIVRTSPCSTSCPPSYMAIPMEIVNEVIYDFYSTKDGTLIHSLKNELPNLDGSCMVINLSCKIFKETAGNCSRYMAQIHGSVVAKLWKNENIWIEGIKSYPAPSLTVCEHFDRDFCGAGYVEDGSCGDAEEEIDEEDCGCRNPQKPQADFEDCGCRKPQKPQPDFDDYSCRKPQKPQADFEDCGCRKPQKPQPECDDYYEEDYDDEDDF